MLLPRRIAAQLQNTLPKEPERPASTTQIFYYHTDHLGTPRELTNTDGHIVWEARYQAWGRAHQIDYPSIPHTLTDGNTQRQIWIELPPHEQPVQNLRFQGQYHDEETGLHYNRFRYYDPDVGRFASQDPIGLAGEVNTYQYAPNPVVWVDPLGLCKCPDVVPKRVTPNAQQAANLKRFQKKIPSNSKDSVELRELPNGGVVAQATSPGRVPGSKAVYEKQIDVNGKTVQATKTTYDPHGNIVHVKDKLNGGTFP